MPHKAGSGLIIGMASEDGKPSQKRITLMDRTNMRVIRKTISDETGGFVFNGLNPDTNDYLIFCVDDDGDEKKKPIIYDYVKPIMGHSGASYDNNWLTLAMQKNPLYIFTGKVEDEVILSYSPYPTKFLGNGYQHNLESLTPYAPNLPAFQINNGCLLAPLQTPDNITKEISVEWVLDTNSVKDKISLAIFSQENRAGYYNNYFNNSKYSNYLFRILDLTFDKTTKKLAVGGFAGYYDIWNVSASYVEYLNHIIDYDGIIHIAVSVDIGNECNLYINSKKVLSVSISDKYIYNLSSNHRMECAIFGGMDVSTLIDTTGKIGVFSCYAKKLNDDEVIEHYQALFTKTLPRQTGYAKAIITDMPLYYYRFLETDDEMLCKDWLIQDEYKSLAKIKDSLIQQVNSSIVTGGCSYNFSGGALVCRQLINDTYNTTGFSFECILHPSNITDTNKTLVRHHKNDINQYGLFIYLNNNNNIVIDYKTRNISETITFDYVLQQKMTHISIVVNKKIKTAILYADGIMVDSKQINATNINTIHYPNNEQRVVSIAGVVDSNNNISFAYHGLLSEVAFYPYPLTNEAVLRHVEAMSVI